jgi:hypothetical protein
MSTADITLIIGGIPTISAAVIAIIVACKSNAKSNATTAQLTSHINTHPAATFQERTGTSE